MLVTSGLGETSKLIGQGLGGTTFDGIALGTSNAAVTTSQTALSAEIVTGSGVRKFGASVTGALATTTFANDTLRFSATWQFADSYSLGELGIFNAASAGVMLLRQIFAALFAVIPQDTLQVQMDIIGSDDVVAATNIINRIGIVQQNRLMAADLVSTTARIRAIALGTGSTALADTQTALAAEISSAGTGLQKSQGSHTVALDTELVTNDTVKVTSVWTVAASTSVTEQALTDDPANSTGNAWVRYLYATPLALIPTDQYTAIMRYVNK